MNITYNNNVNNLYLRKYKRNNISITNNDLNINNRERVKRDYY